MNIRITESQYNWLLTNPLNEDVYVNDVKGKKANLTYSKRGNTNPTKNFGNLNSSDMLDTGKMDQDNDDTFIVPLKGGIKSYNITSIKGVEVMHYFKNKVTNKKTEMPLVVNGKKDEYQLMMEDSEFQNFLNTFIHKVNIVVNNAIEGFDNKNFSGVSIYPVPSSSNFNTFMCKAIAGKSQISGLNTRAVTNSIFRKDLTDLQKDTDFINKNKAYYNDKMFKGGNNNMTHEEYIDDTIRKYNNTTAAQDQTLIDEYNLWVNRIITSYRQKVNPKTIAKNYMNLVDTRNKIREKLKKSHWENAFKQLKYAKGPSVQKRSEAIWNIITPILGKTYMSNNRIDIVEIEKNDFQIKNLTNDTRMGLKNYFKAEENIDEEIKTLKNTVFVIFDDNISGGATLSDICLQCKKLGLEYLVPITFGEMRTKYTQGFIQINKPTKSGKFENY